MRWLIFIALLGTQAGCHQDSLNRQDLRSAAIQIESIAAEAALFSEFVEDGHATDSFTQANPEYLNELSSDIVETLSQKPPARGLANNQLVLQRLAGRLKSRIAASPAAIRDISSMDDSRREFQKIADEARQARNSL